MRVDVYLVVGGDAGLLNRERERAGRALRLGVRGGDVIRVAGVAVADELGVDFGVPRQRVFVFLQKQHAGALAHDEAAALRVEGDGGAVGVAAFAERHRVGKPGDGQRADRRLAAAGEDGVGIAVRDGAVSLAHRVGGGGAGRHHRQRRPLRAEADGDGAGGHIGNHHRDKEGRHPPRPAAFELERFADEGGHPADARPDVNAEPRTVDFPLDAAVGHRLHRRAHRVLREQVGAAHLAFVRVIVGGRKVLDLRRQLCFVVRRVKPRNRRDAVSSRSERIPKAVYILADRGDGPQSGHNHSSHMRLRFQIYRPPSTLSTSPVM